MSSLSSAWRIGATLGLLFFGLVELAGFLALLAGPSGYPLLVHGVLALLAGGAGVALWLHSPRAPAAIVALAGVFAATRLIDAFVLGIRPWLFALLSALAALVAALLLTTLLRTQRSPVREAASPPAHDEMR
jgi:hypothetical protein